MLSALTCYVARDTSTVSTSSQESNRTVLSSYVPCRLGSEGCVYQLSMLEHQYLAEER